MPTSCRVTQSPPLRSALPTPTASAFDCAEASYSQAVAHAADRCGEFVYQSIHTGEGCGYLIVKYTFGAGDTFMAFYDKDSHDVVGWRFMSDTEFGACAGEVPEQCFEYGFTAPPNGVNLCPGAGAPYASPDASPDADVPDADVPDADVPDGNAPETNLPDAGPLDGSVDASDVVAAAIRLSTCGTKFNLFKCSRRQYCFRASSKCEHPRVAHGFVGS